MAKDSFSRSDKLTVRRHRQHGHAKFFTHLEKTRNAQSSFWDKVRWENHHWIYEGDEQWPKDRAWELLYAEVPEGWFVIPTCDVANCVSPYHMFLGDFRDVRYVVKKRRGQGPKPLTEQDRKEIEKYYSSKLVRREDLAKLYGLSTTQLRTLVLRQRSSEGQGDGAESEHQQGVDR